MLQGPCRGNQEFLVTTGINDVFMKIVRANFTMLCSLEDGEGVAMSEYEILRPLPEAGRRLKGLVFECINAILDGHNDSVIYNAVAAWLDGAVSLLKERLVKNHLFFLSYFCGQNIYQKARPKRRLAVPTEEQMQVALYNLTEEDIDNYFQEPLQLMKLIRAISSVSISLKDEMEPTLPDVKSAHKPEYQQECQYFQAFHFFSMQVRCIEFVLPSQQLSALYFIRPIATWYFLEAAKREIMSSITLDTQDAKIAEFLDSATDHFLQMEHTKRLSEWKLCRSCCGCFQHPFRFFLASNGQNLVRLNRLKLAFNFLLCGLLVFTVGEPVEDQMKWTSPGRKLMASVDDEVKDITYVTKTWESVVRGLEIVVCVCSSVVLVVMLLLYVPVLFAKEKELAAEIRDESTNRYAGLVGTLGCLIVLVALLGSLFLSFSGTKWSGHDPRYTFLIFCPAVLLTKGWFESLGRDGPASYLVCMVGTLARILRNENLLAVTACFYLTVVAIATEDPFWYSITLLEIVIVSSDLRTAVDAVIKPFKGLVNMMFLMVIVVFIFAFYDTWPM